MSLNLVFLINPLKGFKFKINLELPSDFSLRKKFEVTEAPLSVKGTVSTTPVFKNSSIFFLALIFSSLEKFSCFLSMGRSSKSNSIGTCTPFKYPKIALSDIKIVHEFRKVFSFPPLTFIFVF